MGTSLCHSLSLCGQRGLARTPAVQFSLNSVHVEHHTGGHAIDDAAHGWAVGFSKVVNRLSDGIAGHECKVTGRRLEFNLVPMVRLPGLLIKDIGHLVGFGPQPLNAWKAATWFPARSGGCGLAVEDGHGGGPVMSFRHHRLERFGGGRGRRALCIARVGGQPYPLGSCRFPRGLRGPHPRTELSEQRGGHPQQCCALRNLSEDDLFERSLERMEQLLHHAEIKSGYGLDLESSSRCCVWPADWGRWTTVYTFLLPAVPAGWRRHVLHPPHGSGGAARGVCRRPRVRRHLLREGYFGLEETRLLSNRPECGDCHKVHVNQFGGGSVGLCTEYGRSRWTTSVRHCRNGGSGHVRWPCPCVAVSDLPYTGRTLVDAGCALPSPPISAGSAPSATCTSLLPWAVCAWAGADRPSLQR